MGIAGTISQHGKIIISLRIGNVATLKGDLDEAGSDTAGIIHIIAPLSSDGGRQPCGGDTDRIGEKTGCDGTA